MRRNRPKSPWLSQLQTLFCCLNFVDRHKSTSKPRFFDVFNALNRQIIEKFATIYMSYQMLFRNLATIFFVSRKIQKYLPEKTRQISRFNQFVDILNCIQKVVANTACLKHGKVLYETIQIFIHAKIKFAWSKHMFRQARIERHIKIAENTAIQLV